VDTPLIVSKCPRIRLANRRKKVSRMKDLEEKRGLCAARLEEKIAI